jgi:hypothetical protein
MSPGLTERPAGDEQSRTIGQAGFDGLLQGVAGAAGIADHGKAPPQHAAQQQRRTQHHQHIRHVHLLRQIELDGDSVHVQVDQAGHQRPALQVDGPIRTRLQRPVRNLLDHEVLDQHVASFAQFRLERIEQSGILEQDTGHEHDTGHGGFRC